MDQSGIQKSSNYNPILFYDGDCGFCHSSVQFILKHRKRDFYFLPLQSATAEAIIKKHGIKIEMDTMYFLKGDKLYEKSSAALQVCRGLRGGYPLMFGFYIIPKFLRDPFYNFVARRRHRIRSGYCYLPSEEEKQFFIA
jgi:predicted DCC family thiol-disulfide oxidoreductase YuxK